MKFIVFFQRDRVNGKKDSTTSLNVGEQFLDGGVYENYCFFEGL
jgi:hypothetical protein